LGSIGPQRGALTGQSGELNVVLLIPRAWVEGGVYVAMSLKFFFPYRIEKYMLTVLCSSDSILVEVEVEVPL
jgi:hypothetical protein